MTKHHTAHEKTTEYVTVMVGEQLFGIPLSRLHDVFVPERLTRVPLAPPEIAGVLNLRGRIITAIDMRRRLGLSPRPAGATSMAVGIEGQGESYGLLIDSVGEVLKLADAACEPNPVNLDPDLVKLSAGVHRLDGQLMLVLDVDQALALDQGAVAA